MGRVLRALAFLLLWFAAAPLVSLWVASHWYAVSRRANRLVPQQGMVVVTASHWTLDRGRLEWDSRYTEVAFNAKIDAEIASRQAQRGGMVEWQMYPIDAQNGVADFGRSARSWLPSFERRVAPRSVRAFLSVPMWAPTTAVLALCSVPVFKLIWRNRRTVLRLRKGLCIQCGFDLRATPGRCPECGTTVN